MALVLVGQDNESCSACTESTPKHASEHCQVTSWLLDKVKAVLQSFVAVVVSVGTHFGKNITDAHRCQGPLLAHALFVPAALHYLQEYGSLKTWLPQAYNANNAIR